MAKAGPRWTPGEDAIVWALPVADAVRRLGRKRSAVYDRRHKLGFTSRRDWQPDEDLVLLRALDAQDTLKIRYGTWIEIARDLGRSVVSVTKRAAVLRRREGDRLG